ncbi:MAG: efflux RND transporter periplasmic adaptor subunit [Balneola sp.]
MNNQQINLTLFIVLISLFTACNTSEVEEQESTNAENPAMVQATEGEEENAAHLSELKFNSLGIQVDTLSKRALSGLFKANGQLEVPPQHEATVTAILGANVTSIEVIEGDKVNKNQILAYAAHPNLTNIQTQYVRTYEQMLYLEKELARQQRLYEEEVGSGQTLQKTVAEHKASVAEVKGYEAQLKQLNLGVEKIRSGNIYETVPIVSPIEGYIEDVSIQIGQYVDPQTELFMIVNNEHIHADLMVFEKDVYQVKKGQKVSFTVQSIPDGRLTGKIYSVGKQFEQNPKAVHVHAEIDQKEGFLIPGMYINGTIYTTGKEVFALPESAIIDDENKTYMFSAIERRENGKTEWKFTPIEIKTGLETEGWVEVKLLEPLPKGTKVAWNNAYSLIAEMKKSQTSHGH